MNLLKLNSVGSVLDMEDNVVYPQLVGGLPDLNIGVHLDECSDEWVLSQSMEDKKKFNFPQASTYLEMSWGLRMKSVESKIYN